MVWILARVTLQDRLFLLYTKISISLSRESHSHRREGANVSVGFRGNKEQAQAPGQDKKVCPEKQPAPEQFSFRFPNSLMMDIPVTPPQGTPNSVMREMMDPQIPAAEEEADRLSAGIRSGTPDTVRREMGSRLGTDFSAIRFHTGPESVRVNELMGSRAYTRGGDVFFGSGGFSPSVAAHELVHTVQQGAASGHVNQSVSFGTIQRSFKQMIKNRLNNSKGSLSQNQQDERTLAAGGTKRRWRIAGLFGSLSDDTIQKLANYYKEDVLEKHIIKNLNNDQDNTLAADTNDNTGNNLISNNNDNTGNNLISNNNDNTGNNLIANNNDNTGNNLISNNNDNTGNNLITNNNDNTNHQNPEEDQAVRDPILQALDAARRAWAGSSARQQDNDSNSINNSFDITANQNHFQELPEQYRNNREDYRTLLEQFRDNPEQFSNLPPEFADLAREFSEDSQRFGNLLEQVNNIQPASLNQATDSGQTTAASQAQEGEEEPVISPENGFWKETKAAYTWAGSGNEAAKGGFSAYKTGAVSIANWGTGGKKFFDKDSWKLPWNKYSQNVDPMAGGITNALGTAQSLTETVKGIGNTVNNVKNVKEGDSHWDWIGSLLDTGASGAKTAAGAMETIRNFNNFGKAAASAASASPAIPILGLVTGALSGLRGIIQANRSKKAENAIQNKILFVGEGDNKLLKILRHGKKAAHINRVFGNWKAFSGLLSILSGAATMFGAVPVSLGIGVLSGAVNAFRGIYERWKRNSLRNDIVAEEYDIDWDKEIPIFRLWLKSYNSGMGLRNKEVREIILKAHGAKDKTRTDAFKRIRLKRAKYLVNIANNNAHLYHDTASAVIEGFGITRNKNSNSFTEGAIKILADKLA